MARIAVIQHAPRVLDREATLDKAVQLVAEAAAKGAQLVVFPEAFIPGYPAWVWRLRPLIRESCSVEPPSGDRKH